MKNEIWKDIVGYEGYQISNQGNIKTLLRSGKYSGMLLKPHRNKRRVVVALKKGNKRYNVDVARLVCEHFKPCDKKNLHIEHLDGNIFNNSVDNLKWSKKTMKQYMGETMSEINRKGLNEYRIDNATVYVKLRNSDIEMICDIDDWNTLKSYTWFYDQGYAIAGRNKKFHRMVVNPPKGMVVDHINRNRLDNRRVNLRIVTSHVNSLNTSVQKNNTTKYLGVHKTRYGTYHATIKLNGKNIGLGTFKNIDEAIKARKEAEDKLFKPIIDRETISFVYE